MIRETIVAPHLDDAALSCWHKIERTGTEVMTVFAGIPDTTAPSWWDRLNGQSNAQESMQLRQAENASALANTPTVITNLDFLDHPYAKGKRDIKAITDNIESRINPEAALIVGAGIGTLLRQHPDHVTIRKAGLLMHERGRDVSFYADVPYSLPIRKFEDWPRRLSIEKLKRLFNSDVEVETIELDPSSQLDKRAAVATYRSQFKTVNMLALNALKKSAAYRFEALIHCV